MGRGDGFARCAGAGATSAARIRNEAQGHGSRGTNSPWWAVLGYPPMTSKKDEFSPCSAVFCALTKQSREDACKGRFKGPRPAGADATSAAGMAV